MLEEQRKLVTLRVINEIKVHPNADSLELAIIDGWQIVVAKNQFSAGDMVVYFEIDSLIPVSPEFEFLRKYAYVNKGWLTGLIPNNEGFRIRTIKLRGEISQGLVIPLPSEIGQGIRSGIYLTEGDYSQYFGVIKYDPPTSVGQQLSIGRKGNFPSFIVKTKQERVQNIPAHTLQEIFESDELFEITRKYHGSSTTVYVVVKNDYTTLETICRKFKEFFGFEVEKEYKVGVCSHNVELDINKKDNSFVNAAFKTKLADALRLYAIDTDRELAVQAELCGPNLHSNHHGLSEDTLFIFDIYDIQEQRYLLPLERNIVTMMLSSQYGYKGQLATMEFGYITLPYPSASDLLKLGEYSLAGSGKQNEGLVFKSLSRDFSFKAVSNAFLLEAK